MKAPIIPQQKGQPAEEAMLEVKRVVEGIKDKPAFGILTEPVSLGAMGEVQVVQHGLGKKPRSWHMTGLIGWIPEIQIDSVDEKRIRFTSLRTAAYTSRFSFWVW